MAKLTVKLNRGELGVAVAFTPSVTVWSLPSGAGKVCKVMDKILSHSEKNGE